MNTKREKLAEGVPLAMIVKRELAAAADVVMLSQPRSVFAEKFRRLRSVLVHTYGDESRVIVVTSGIPGEGKSTVSLNLALAFSAEGGARTLLIDGDMRRPSIGRKISPTPQLGLSEVLLGKVDLVHAVVHLSNTPLHVLPAGAPANDPHELLTSPEVKDLFKVLRESYDRIIVDTPPIIPFTDADSLGALSDGVLLVARAKATPRSAYAQEAASITSTRILGVVLNGAQSRLSDGGSYYYHAYYERDRNKDA